MTRKHKNNAKNPQNDNKKTPTVDFVCEFCFKRYKNIIEDDISPKKMTNDWEPNQNCLDVLKLARIDENFARNQIPEFKLYWIDSNQVMTSWNSKFIQHVKFKWYKNNSESSGIISRLTDKDWAIEY